MKENIKSKETQSEGKVCLFLAFSFIAAVQCLLPLWSGVTSVIQDLSMKTRSSLHLAYDQLFIQSCLLSLILKERSTFGHCSWKCII